MGLPSSGRSCSAFGRASETSAGLRVARNAEVKTWSQIQNVKSGKRIIGSTFRERRHQSDQSAAAPGRQQGVEGIDICIDRADIRIVSAAGGRLTRRYRLVERSRVGTAC